MSQGNVNDVRIPSLNTRVHTYWHAIDCQHGCSAIRFLSSHHSVAETHKLTHAHITIYRKFNDVHELFANIKFSSVLKEEYEVGIMESNENAIKQMSAHRIRLCSAISKS